MSGTRERIVTATNELFRRKGYNGTSLKDITSAAAATTGSLYHFWPGGKDELTAEVLITSGAIYRELFEASMADASDPGQALVEFFAGGAEILESTDFIDPCPIGGVAREVASTNEALRGAADGVFHGWIESAQAFLERAGLSPDVARDLASTMVATIEGGFVLARTTRNTTAFTASGRHMKLLVDAALIDAGVAAR